MSKACDIVLLSYESPDLLKKCVESVLLHTDTDSNLIIVDNGSKDPEVRNYLNNLSGNDKISVEKLLLAQNYGFAAGMNRGMKIATAPYVCILNNDCIVTDGWLGEMIDVAEKNSEVGLINPQSNTFGFWREGVPVNDHAALVAPKKGAYTELGNAIGFACLVKKEVIEKIGYLDEAYEGVCYEDTDYSIRAARAGYIAVVAEGAYVFHKEQASRRNLKDRAAIYRKNRELFENKWGRNLRLFYMDMDLDAGGDNEETSYVYERLKQLARERIFVDMVMRGEKGTSLAEKFGMVRHADIKVTVLPCRLAAFYPVWKVFTKKKKYDAVVMRRGFVCSLLGALKFLHGARTFILTNDDEITDGNRLFDMSEAKIFADFLRSKG